MAHDGRVDETVEQPARPNARMRQTMWDMVRSMAVVLVVVFAIVLLAWRPQPDPITVVDPAPVVAMAVAQADFPISAPSGLPAGWRATSARWEPTPASGDDPVLHMGYVTPADEYAQVSQSRDSSAPYLAEQTAKGIPTGSQDVTGRSWQRWEADGRRSLVLQSAGVTTVVSGSASWDELVALAAALRPVEEQGT